MKEEMQGELMDIVQRLGEEGFKALDFAKSEMPEVLSQALAWASMKAMSLCILCCIFAILFGFVCIKIIKTYNKNNDGFVFITGVASLGFGVASIVQVIIWFKIQLAPKLWLFEYIKNSLYP